MELGVAGHGRPLVGSARQLLQEALVVMRSAVWEAPRKLLLCLREFQHSRVSVEGGDRVPCNSGARPLGTQTRKMGKKDTLTGLKGKYQGPFLLVNWDAS